MASDNTPKQQKVRRRPIKMEDLAELAGVSKSTVSRALSDSPLVSQKTRDRIKALAKENNYRLNMKARNFFLRERLTIAVLMPHANNVGWRILDPFFLELLGNIADALNDAGHELLLAKTSSQSIDWIEDYTKLHRCDGMILIGQGSEHEKINKLTETFDAFVVWGARLPDQKYFSVGSDNLNGGKIATDHLLGLGRKNIVFLGQKSLPEVKLRNDGYKQALANNNVEFEPDLQVESPFDSDRAYDAMVEFIESGVEFDSIFAASDILAMSAVRALKKHGLEVPQDVSVVGYDDIMLASYYNPSLTTIRQNCPEGGKLLVEQLLRIIEGGEAESFILPTELVVRHSCGADVTKN